MYHIRVPYFRKLPNDYSLIGFLVGIYKSSWDLGFLVKGSIIDSSRLLGGRTWLATPRCVSRGDGEKSATSYGDFRPLNPKP